MKARRPARPNPHMERAHRLAQAREAFVKAAASTYDVTPRARGHVVFFASLGMLRSLRVALEVLEQVREERRDPGEAEARATREGLGL